MRVAITADPEIPVPPTYYGGIERIVDMLARGLTERGHDVHVFASADSSTSGVLHAYVGRKSRSAIDTFANAALLRREVLGLGNFDIIHSFGRLAYLTTLLFADVPKIQSYQRAISPKSVRWGLRLLGTALSFTACSESCAKPVRSVGGQWTIIPNGAPADRFTFSERVNEDSPLVFLGRIERIKGVHTAISVASRSGKRLIIAGNKVGTEQGELYFEQEIAPFCDGDRIRYIGPINDEQKNELLGTSSALLFPIEWEEPFGIVMVEALACGTPVVGLSRGAVREVIEDRATGFVCLDRESMEKAVAQIATIDRRRCRQAFESRFSDSVIVNRYEELYRQRMGLR